jgi:Protein of unknwon function (DUF3310)
MSDNVNHPPHYKAHPSGVECIQITEHMNFCLGNAVKYIWRADEKGNDIEDLEKAVWYIRREIERRSSSPKRRNPPAGEVNSGGGSLEGSDGGADRAGAQRAPVEELQRRLMTLTVQEFNRQEFSGDVG